MQLGEGWVWLENHGGTTILFQKVSTNISKFTNLTNKKQTPDTEFTKQCIEHALTLKISGKR